MRLLNQYRANEPKSSIFCSLSALSIRLCATKTARSFLLTALTLLASLVFSSSHALAQSPPGSVSSVSLSRADGTVTATWPAVSGATKYHVTYSTDGGASWHAPVADHRNVPTNSLTFSADNAKTYIVGVRAGNDEGWGGWTNSPAAGPYAPEPPKTPATPTSVTVTRSDGTLTASWPAVAGATSYHITYSSDSGASWSLAALNHPNNSIAIGVDNAKTYIVGVRARNEHGDSGWTNSPSAGPYTPDDTAPPPVISATVTIADASADEGDALSFTVTLDNAVPDGLTVTPSFTDGTATNGTDYTANTNALNFTGTAGETQTFTVSTTEDTDVEDNETFTVGLTASGTTHSITASDTATGTINNDDSAPVSTPVISATVTIDDAKATEGKSIAFTVTLDNAVPGGLKVTPSFTDGTATKGTDYTAYTAALDFVGTAGESVSFTVPTTDDTEGELDETFTVGLSVSGTSHTVTATDTATGTIKDNEEVTAQWWFGARLSLSPGSVSENGGKQKVTVTAEVSEWGTSTSDLSYVVTVGKGGDSAVSGTDYKAVSKFNINIKSGRRSGSNAFYLEPIGDTDWEGNETITIHASGTDGAQSTTLTLTDEGDRPYSGPQVTLSANPPKLSEADGATTVTLTATSTAHSVARTVAVSVGASGTARSGTDYAAVSNFTITLAKNATSATGTFTLTPTQDKLAEGDETIAIAGNVNGVTAKLTGTTLTLTDDDAALDITLSVSPVIVTENGGAKTVTVTATAATAAAKARTVLVAVGNRQDTATPGTDYTVVPAFNITIAANATSATGSFTLTPTQDTSVEDAELISIDGTPESAGANFTVGGAAMALTDDDAQPAVTLTATPSSVGEAALATSVTVKATAASAVAWARTVTISVGENRLRGLGYGLRGGVELRHHHRGQRAERHGHLHPEADPRHHQRGQRDHRRGRQQPEHDGDRRHGDARRRRHQSGGHAVGKPGERSRECIRNLSGRDGHGRIRDYDGQDGIGEGGRRHGDLRYGLHGSAGLHAHYRGQRAERHGHLHPDPDPGHLGRGRRDHRRFRQQHRHDGDGNHLGTHRRRHLPSDHPLGEHVERS